jgi:hypothetical protein
VILEGIFILLVIDSGLRTVDKASVETAARPISRPKKNGISLSVRFFLKNVDFTDTSLDS